MRKIQTVKNDFLREQYDVVEHESGLLLYVFPKKLSTAYASLTVRFGSLHNVFRLENEAEELALPDGIAHFLEHKMFESEDHIDTFDKFAAVGANANAYTSNEVTSYLFSAPGDISEPLKILLDYVFHPYFTEKNVQKEVGIIGQEIKMYEDSPMSRLYSSTMELLYVNHGIRTNICGTYASISEITPELLLRCHSAFYKPDNMILIVVGDVSTEEVLALVDMALPKASDAATPVPRITEEPETVYKKSLEFHMDISRPKLCVGIKDIHLPAASKERERRAITMNLLCDLFFGESTHFFDRLYREGLISNDFSACYETIGDCGHLLVSGATDEPERLLAELRAEFRRIQTAPTAEEADFLRIRGVHYAEYIKDFDSTEEIATALLDAVIDGTELFDTGGVIHSVTLSEVFDLCREFFDEERLVYTLITPTKGASANA